MFARLVTILLIIFLLAVAEQKKSRRSRPRQ